MIRAKLPIIMVSGFLIGALLAFVILASSQNLQTNQDLFSKEVDLQTDSPTIGKIAPDFTIAGVKNENISLSDYRGRNVILNFWATWCGPCRLEMPLFQDSFTEFDNDITILGINDGESRNEIAKFINEIGITFDVGIDKTGEVKEDYLVIGLPSTYFLDTEGRIVAIHIGAMTKSQLDGYLDILGVNVD